MSSWIAIGLAVGGAVAVVGLIVVAVVARRHRSEAATRGLPDLLGAVVVALFVGALCGLVAATVAFLVQ